MGTFKDQVRAATTANITLSSAQTIDGVDVKEGDRVLVKDQSLPEENGVYEVVDGASWNRAMDADDASELLDMTVRVFEGGMNAHTAWSLRAGSIIVETTPLRFIRDVTTHAFRNLEALKAYPAKGGLQVNDVGILSGIAEPCDGGGGDFTFVGVLPAAHVIAASPHVLNVSHVDVDEGGVTVTTSFSRPRRGHEGERVSVRRPDTHRVGAGGDSQRHDVQDPPGDDGQ